MKARDLYSKAFNYFRWEAENGGLAHSVAKSQQCMTGTCGVLAASELRSSLSLSQSARRYSTSMFES